MEKVFSTTYVCADDSGKTTLKSFQGHLHPGQPFLIDGKSNILLAGGFESLSPDSPFPLSPVLKLQSDCKSLTEEQLASIAEAELFRLQSATYHSYHVEADPRVCVLSKNVTELDDFIDTYGGILDIHPLLIGGGSADYGTVTEYQVEAFGKSCRIRYRKRSPLNEKRCSYCSACGQVCPERCISPHLYVDYNRCSFCKECEKVCEAGALDIYGVEEIVVAVPALIVLGDAEPLLPEGLTCVYQQDQLPAFFKTLFAAEIKEVVCHNNSICQYSGRLGIGCGRCIDSCPHGALSRRQGGIRIDHDLCGECGNCIAVCPTGAMQHGDFDDPTLLQYLERLSIPQGGDLVIGSEKALHTFWWQVGSGGSGRRFYLEYANIHALSFVHLLLFFASGFRRIVLLEVEGDRKSEILKDQVEKANTIIASLFEVENFTEIVSAMTINDTLLDSDPVHPLSRFWTMRKCDTRRELLSGLLEHLLAQSGRYLEGEYLLSEFHSVNCRKQGCTQCLACLNECKTQALQADEKSLSLTYLASHCVGCGVCIRVCPEKVLSMKEISSIDKPFFQRTLVAQAEPAVCKRCGKVYGTRKSLDRVIQILSAKEPVNTDHFEYCSTCRVVNLFEAETT